MSTTTQAPQAGSTRQGVEPPARFDWMQVVRHTLFACLCGVVCGFASIVLCLFVGAARHLFERAPWLIWLLPVMGVVQLLMYRWWKLPLNLTTDAVLCLFVGAARHLFERAPWLIWLLPVMGVVQLLMYRWWKLPLNLTTDAIIEKMRAGDHLSALLAPGILFSTSMTILAGGSVGKEAGALQIGASLGTTIAKPFRLHNILRCENHDDAYEINRYIASTGMAAAFSALFFAPLGSCMLVLELMRFTQLQYVTSMLIACFIAFLISNHFGIGDVINAVPVPAASWRIIGVCIVIGIAAATSMLIACFIAFLISNHFGIGDVINAVPVPAASWRIIGVCIVIGIAAAMAGSVFAIAIRLLQALTMRIRHNYFVWVIVSGLLFAVLVTVFGWWRFTGSGGEMLNDVLNMPDLSADFAIKMLLTVLWRSPCASGTIILCG